MRLFMIALIVGLVSAMPRASYAGSDNDVAKIVDQHVRGALRGGSGDVAHAALPAYPFPRFRSLALFDRRPHERVDRYLTPTTENLHIRRHERHDSAHLQRKRLV